MIGVIRAFFYKLRFNKIGFPSKLGRPLKLKNARNVSLGKRVRIMSGYRIECYNGGTVNIGDDVSIGQNLHMISGGKLTVGNHVTFSGNVFISNLNHSYEKLDVSALRQENIIKGVSVGDFCFVGYGACILPGTQLGKNVIVGANSVVCGKFPDYVVVAGVPAKIIKKYNFENNKWERI